MTKTITRPIGEGTTDRIKPRPRRLQLDNEPAADAYPIFFEVCAVMRYPEQPKWGTR